MKQKDQHALHLIIIAILAIGLVYALYQIYILKQNNQVSQIPQLTTVTPALELTPTKSATVTPLTSPKPVQNGASLEKIRYTLPANWTAELRDGGLDLHPSGGGILFIKAHSYPGTIGRRDFYCKTTGYCIDATYFTEMNIGNISGYMANALDNSGGGAEYFGSKGNMFYIISSYNPPLPNEFDKTYKTVLSSLVF